MSSLIRCLLYKTLPLETLADDHLDLLRYHVVLFHGLGAHDLAARLKPLEAACDCQSGPAPPSMAGRRGYSGGG